MRRKLAMVRRAHYVCGLARDGDAANWTGQCKTRRPVLRNITVYTTQIANSVIAWSTSEKHVLSQADVDLLRRTLPNREIQECTQSSNGRL